MVTIRLTRTGRKNFAHYRVVIANQRSKRDGEFIAYVGTYDPNVKPSKIELDKETIKDWLAKGAQPTPTVKYLLVTAGILTKPKKVELKTFKSKPGKKAVARGAAKVVMTEKKESVS